VMNLQSNKLTALPVEIANLQLPQLHSTLAYPPAFGVSGRGGGVTAFEFCRDFRRQKTRVPGLSSLVWRYLRDPTFSRFSRTSTCDRQIDDS